MTIMQEQLKHMTAEMFAHLGEDDVVYIKPIKRGNADEFAVHAANGTELAVFDSFEDAVVSSMQSNMHPTRLH